MREILIYNSLTKKKEPLQPIHEGNINMFVCGPTVYDYMHLGNAKTYTQFDFIAQYLRFGGYKVNYVQNITDIDDKIIIRAKEKKKEWKDLSQKYAEIYKKDMKALHNKAVSSYALATNYIPQIVSQIQILMDEGFAYRTEDGVYFEIKKDADYGKLSGRMNVEKNDAVSRIDESSSKRGWNDFCIWKNSKEGEPFWDTEIGKGRPGWHIEDTAITESIFGPQYDIHGGAVDLIFPHHEAEIALMESASGKKPFVRYWLHTGFLNTNNEKMSKSLNNFSTARDVLKNYDYRTIRYLFLSSHYRLAINFNDALLLQTEGALARLNEFVLKIDRKHDDKEYKKSIHELRDIFYGKLDDDFDTPNALAQVFEFISMHNAQNTKLGRNAFKFFKEMNGIFDFLDLRQVKIDSDIEALIKKREVHRKNNEFDEADKIRDALAKRGIQLDDTAAGVRWKRVS